MCAADAKSKPALGFLTVLEHPQHGLFGGYLLLNTSGRPLEFHCTAPIKPNRAQEILYGPTLRSFLYGEQIGQTLLEKARIEPLVLCTDRQPVLAVREHVALPVALVLADDANPASGPVVEFWLGRNRLAVAGQYADDCRVIEARISELAETFDLAEPFQRIREAIEEAQQAVRAPACPAA